MQIIMQHTENGLRGEDGCSNMGLHSTNEVLFCLCLHRESVLHVSLSVSLCICRHYAVSFCFELRDLADMLCVCVLWYVAALKLLCRMLGVS